MIYAFRLLLHTILLDWAVSIMPKGPEKQDFLRHIVPYLEKDIARKEKDIATWIR